MKLGLGAVLAIASLSGCGEGSAWNGWNLIRVQPDHSEPDGAARVAADGLVLDPGAQAEYFLELSAGGELTIRARSADAGTLELLTRDFDPEDTRRVSESSQLLRLPGLQRFDARVSLPGARDRVLVLELVWSGSSSPLMIESLEVTPTQPRRRPSIVLFSVDTLAARHLSLHGYPRETTPHLDRFAEEAVVFERCSANACWTTPSYMSQLTGLDGSSFWSDLEDELFEDMEWNHYYLSDPHWTLAEMLRASGYRTGAFIDNQKMGSHLGLAQGFEVFDESAAAISHSVPNGGAVHAMGRALDWLDSLPEDAPVFLFVQVMDVHGPYLPAQPFAGRFRGDEHWESSESPISYRIRGIWSGIPRYVVKPLFPRGEVPTAMDTAPIIAAYDEEILATDDVFRRLLDALDERGLGDAAVVFSADHGEAMLEHESFFSHHTVYQETLHVPLVMRLPDGLGAGTRIADQVQLVDLYPTLAEVAGLELDRTHLTGRSLLPVIRGEELPEAVVYSIGGMFNALSITHGGWKLIESRPRMPKYADEFLSWPRARALLNERYPEVADLIAGASEAKRFDAGLAKYGTDRRSVAEELLAELEGPLYELYYLPDDPLEEHDLADEQPERVAQLTELLVEGNRRSRAARIELPEPPVIRPPTESEIQELRDLGYVGD